MITQNVHGKTQRFSKDNQMVQINFKEFGGKFQQDLNDAALEIIVIKYNTYYVWRSQN